VRRAYEVLTDPARRRTYDSGLGTPPAWGGGDWFADEVAIDFPSVASVLDRMQDAFFGGVPAAGLNAEVILSPQEAFWGTTIPLGVPLRRICASCGGRGETWQEWCAACEGGGEVPATHELLVRVPAGVREGARFRFRVMPPGAPSTVVEVRVSIR
jgi:DnaJ-class molecular chaperone